MDVDPTKRFDVNDVLSHELFRDFDWSVVTDPYIRYHVDFKDIEDNIVLKPEVFDDEPDFPQRAAFAYVAPEWRVTSADCPTIGQIKRQKERHLWSRNPRKFFNNYEFITGRPFAVGKHFLGFLCQAKIEEDEEPDPFFVKIFLQESQTETVNLINWKENCANMSNVVKMVSNVFADKVMHYVVFEKLHGENLLQRFKGLSTVTEVLARCYLMNLMAVLEDLHEKRYTLNQLSLKNFLFVLRNGEYFKVK